MKREDFKIEEKYSYVELVMDRKIRNINKLQEDNFPRSIKFLDKNKKILLELEFNEFGFMVRAINKEQKMIFEDRKVMKKIDIEKLIINMEL